MTRRAGFWISLVFIFCCQVLAQETEYVLSPPAVFHPKDKDGHAYTNLRDLQDAYGLALLLEDQQAAQTLATFCKTWENHYKPLLDLDLEINKINRQIAILYGQLLTDDTRSQNELKEMVWSYPRRKLQPILEGWLRSLFLRYKVYFQSDMQQLEKDQQEELCRQARSMETLEGLSGWRYRLLAWRYKDGEIRSLSSQHDKRVALLAPIRLQESSVGSIDASILDRYLTMLHNLKLQLMQDRTMPYERYRTLSGLLLGFRYMETILNASEITGLDHRMMISLFIQESEFIHHRVSPAGAFSLAQFMSIALKDVWLFKDKITGSGQLLEGVRSYEELKRKVILDPRMAIRVSCLYFKRLRDEVALRLSQSGGRKDKNFYDLLAVEMYAFRQGISAYAGQESSDQLSRVWPAQKLAPRQVLPWPVGVLADASVWLTDWMAQSVREVLRDRISESLFRQRLDRLHSALGLAAYNAGMSNLLKTAKKRAPWAALSFPIQITETRNYVDNILDGTDILKNLDRFSAEISRLGYQGLIKLANRACRDAGLEEIQQAFSPSPAAVGSKR